MSETNRTLDHVEQDGVRILLNAACDRINAADQLLLTHFGVPIEINRRWHRGHPIPTTSFDVLQVIRVLKREWDEKSSLYDMLAEGGIEGAIEFIAFEMGIKASEE